MNFNLLFCFNYTRLEYNAVWVEQFFTFLFNSARGKYCWPENILFHACKLRF